MALIERDLYGAGAKMALSTQVFTNGLNGAGLLPGLIGNTDLLEMRGNDEECPDLPVVGVVGDDANVMTRFPDCYPTNQRTLVLVTFPGGTTTKWGLGQVTHGTPDKVTFGPTQPPGSEIPGGGALAPVPSRVGLFNIVRYEIAPAPDGAPSLYRSQTGGVNVATGVAVRAPDASGGWLLVARGIEDLQVRYELQVHYPPLAAGSVWQDTPGAVGVDADTVVRRVEVMLSARAMAANLQGETTNANLGPAVRAAMRGQLVTRVSPRATLLNLQDPMKIGQGKGWY
jgi:hypothetical protein